MSERSIGPKTTKSRRQFNPAAFLEIAAKGRTVLKHQKKEIIFLQGSNADSVFVHQKGQSQSHRRFQTWQGSGGRNPGYERIRR